jgi:hypothetical protein
MLRAVCKLFIVALTLLSAPVSAEMHRIYSTCFPDGKFPARTTCLSWSPCSTRRRTSLAGWSSPNQQLRPTAQKS